MLSAKASRASGMACFQAGDLVCPGFGLRWCVSGPDEVDDHERRVDLCGTSAWHRPVDDVYAFAEDQVERGDVRVRESVSVDQLRVDQTGEPGAGGLERDGRAWCQPLRQRGQRVGDQGEIR